MATAWTSCRSCIWATRRSRYDEVTGTGRNRISFADVPIERATAYAAEDADVTLRLWEALRPRLRMTTALALYEQMERRLIPILLDMERAGIKVDADDLRRMSVDFEQRMAVMERTATAWPAIAFNVGSPKQLGEELFDEHEPARRQADEDRGVGDGFLGAADAGRSGAELPTRILEWRQLAKLKSTYADALVRTINPETGRVHTSFAMAIASTGRLSSTDPNLQNIPIRTEEGSRIRHAFIAEPGHVLVSADYSQIELRLLAHVADLPVLRESFANGEDIHARTASEVFGVPMAGMDPMTRRRAKAINFGIIYGISGFGLARQLGITPGEARGYIDRTSSAIRGFGCTWNGRSRRPGSAALWCRRSGGGAGCRGLRTRTPARRAYARAAGDQCAVAGRRGGHHQAGDGAAAGRFGARPG